MICVGCLRELVRVGATVGGAQLVACPGCGVVYVDEVDGKKFVKEGGEEDGLVSAEHGPKAVGGLR